ncbi:hypothetical protein CDL15_Pgr016530 [Punica granatum]|uniref:Uncharacterized protein n=1 Tax=Punica granatum TaxID=22663 RepID=A0A218WK55_PUNGR|nr:hypothetical protein CDL15_Pgr016530 [Punica granatum]
MMMMQPAEEGVRDNPKVQKQMPPIHSFKSNGMPMYFFRKPEGKHCYCDAVCDCDVCYRKKRKGPPCSKKAQKKADPRQDPDLGADVGLSTVLKKKKVLPCYKPILKWVRKQKWENPEEIRDYLKDMVSVYISERLVHKMEQKGELAAIPQAAPACMFRPSSPNYDEQFPQLAQFTDGEGRHTHAFKVPNPTSRDEQGRPRFVISRETVLNWQSENTVSQNRVLSSIGTKVDSLTAKVSQPDGKVDRHHQETQSLLRTLPKRLREIQNTPAVSYFQIDPDIKEQEIRKLKNQIVTLSGLQHHHRQPPRPQASSTFWRDHLEKKKQACKALTALSFSERTTA